MNYNKLNSLLLDKRMSIPQLAEKIGMTKRGLYSSIENKTLTVSTLEKISEVLEIPAAIFFEDENDKRNKSALIIEVEKLKKEIKDIKIINKLNENLAASATREAAANLKISLVYQDLLKRYMQTDIENELKSKNS